MKNRFMTLAVLAGILMFVLTACASSNADPLNGTSWALTSSGGTAPVEGTTVTVQFKDGKIGGSSGCNSYGGNYQIDGEKLKVSDVASTLMACTEPEGAMEQEGVFLSDLNNAESFRLSGNQLEVVTSDGKTLTFSPQP